MKALIIIPPSEFLDNDKVFPPLGAYYIKRYVEENSEHTVDILHGRPEFLPGLMKGIYEIIGFSATTPQYKEAVRIMKYLPSWIPTVIGGPHVHHYPVGQDPWDYIVKGDGCKSFLDILNNHIPMGEPDDKNQMPCRNKKLLEYKYFLGGELTTTIMTARGCPNSCAFCEDANTKVRLKDPETVRQEIQECVDLGFGGIMFFDDLFCLNMKRVRELCAVIKPFKIKFRCFAHARNFNDEMALLLAEAGCVEIGYGAECLDQEILDKIKKGSTVEQIYELIRIAHKYNIRVKAFLMLGLPGETLESAQRIEDFVLNSGVDEFDVTVYYPYKGTHIADNIDEYDLFVDNSNSCGYYKGKEGYAECIVRTSDLSAQEIKYWRERIYAHNKRFKSP